MTPADCTVVVVSHHRPDPLARCLRTLEGQGAADVIVVAPLGTVSPRLIPFDERNISAARNHGLAAVRTPLVAFIDDDAEASPDWLAALTNAFAETTVQVATGWVAERQGWQYRGETIDGCAEIRSLPVCDHSRTYCAPQGSAVVAIGTNCAFRMAALRAVGGFDPGFRYFLDDSDISMRLAGCGLGCTAVVPEAVTVHRRAAGPWRRSDGILVDYTEIGASLRRFIWRHALPLARRRAWEDAAALQMRGPVRALIRGTIEPHAVRAARLQLRQGAALAENRPDRFPSEPVSGLRSG